MTGCGPAPGRAPRPDVDGGDGPGRGRAMAAIQIERLTRRHGPVAAVDGVDLAIGEGEFFALVGPSGCGKTSLLRLIAGLDPPDEGRIRIGDLDVTGAPPWDRPVNTVFQSYALFPHLSAGDNVAYGLVRAGMPRSEIARRVAEMLSLVQLSEFAGRKPHQLSGGQRQRVALARALARLPRVLLLDEPMAALDRGLRDDTRRQLHALQRRLGITFVLVTHDQEEAFAVADRMAVMRAGRIVQLGTPRAVYEAPADRHVAAFLGRAALLDGVILAAADDGRVVIDCGPLGRLAGRAVGTLALGQTATLVLRPEHLRLGAEGDDHAALPATAGHAAFHGESVSLGAILADGREIAVSLAPRAACPATGAPVRLAWDPAVAPVVPA